MNTLLELTETIRRNYTKQENSKDIKDVYILTAELKKDERFSHINVDDIKIVCKLWIGVFNIK